MSDSGIKGKTALGTRKKVSGAIKVLTKEQATFKDLPRELKGKILVCPQPISKPVLEKARALGAFGVVTKEIADEELKRLESELKTSWSPSLFACLILDKDLGEELSGLEGKMGTIDVEKKKLLVE